ncbi:methylmalonyl-CoA/ethylmalonyl-CoA epimerase [Halanaerobium sp. DL-01]|uniref:VOC family protein n=1 Tax=Halanaerobium sp. DL-01 TaxID=1653064 RepID=UPI000DF29C39|nr:VOC family protein [Halanaerobium sp. DL-01]RCW78129.1 methylmalonyl-CoA/ethylmalonyl-CoA epimerase [Halanaerobium sp. DL-01]
MIKGVHHIAFVVNDLEKGIEIFKNDLELIFQGKSTLEYRGVKVGVFKAGEVLLELIYPYKSGPVKKYLKENGPGFFHLAFDVNDIDNAIDHIIDRAISIKMKDKEAREGLDWKVASFEKNDVLNIIMQFAENK